MSTLLMFPSLFQYMDESQESQVRVIFLPSIKTFFKCKLYEIIVALIKFTLLLYSNDNHTHYHTAFLSE